MNAIQTSDESPTHISLPLNDGHIPDNIGMPLTWEWVDCVQPVASDDDWDSEGAEVMDQSNDDTIGDSLLRDWDDSGDIEGLSSKEILAEFEQEQINALESDKWQACKCP